MSNTDYVAGVPQATPNAVGVKVFHTGQGDVQDVTLDRGAKALTTPSVTTTVVIVLAANTTRKVAVLTNPAGNTATIYIGPATMTTSAYTAALTPGASYIDGDSNDAWYAASSAGTATLAITETA